MSKFTFVTVTFRTELCLFATGAVLRIMCTSMCGLGCPWVRPCLRILTCLKRCRKKDCPFTISWSWRGMCGLLNFICGSNSLSGNLPKTPSYKYSIRITLIRKLTFFKQCAQSSSQRFRNSLPTKTTKTWLTLRSHTTNISPECTTGKRWRFSKSNSWWWILFSKGWMKWSRPKE